MQLYCGHSVCEECAPRLPCKYNHVKCPVCADGTTRLPLVQNFCLSDVLAEFNKHKRHRRDAEDDAGSDRRGRPRRGVPRPCLSLPLERRILLRSGAKGQRDRRRGEEERRRRRRALGGGASSSGEQAAACLAHGGLPRGGRAWTRTAQSATAPPAKSASVDLLLVVVVLLLLLLLLFLLVLHYLVLVQQEAASQRPQDVPAPGRYSHGGRLCSERWTSSAAAAPRLPAAALPRAAHDRRISRRVPGWWRGHRRRQ